MGASSITQIRRVFDNFIWDFELLGLLLRNVE